MKLCTGIGTLGCPGLRMNEQERQRDQDGVGEKHGGRDKPVRPEWINYGTLAAEHKTEPRVARRPSPGPLNKASRGPAP